MGLSLIPEGTKIPFVKLRMASFVLFAAVFVWAGILSMKNGLNWGIDFKGGFVLTVRMAEKADISAMRQDLSQLELGDITFKEAGSDRDVMIVVEKQAGGEKAQMEALAKIKEKLGRGVEYRSIDTVGPKASEELLTNGLQALLLSLIAMLIYVAVRFQWRFGVCAIVALVHDAIAVWAFYVFTGLEFNMPAILAILITVGYSINDTVVVFDRVRENLAKFSKMAIPELIDLSINETLSRTTITAGTTIVSLVCLYVWGGEVISTYSLPILVGIIVGTYSSIFMSGPLLTFFDIRYVEREVEGFNPVNSNQ